MPAHRIIEIGEGRHPVRCVPGAEKAQIVGESNADVGAREKLDAFPVSSVIHCCDSGRSAEPFDVDEALKYYYPDELTGDEKRIREIVKSLESDYYYSGANTLEEWAKEREKYDVDKDSTGSE